MLSMRTVLLPLFIVFPILMTAQVVNTEKLRLTGKEKTFQTIADFNFGLSRNKAGQTLRLGAQTRLEYEKGKNKWMLLGAYNLTQFLNVDDPDAVPKTFANNTFGHLRYNRKINQWLTWEAFTQGQWDEIQEINLRYLIGTGPRFRIAKNEKSHFYIGTLYMLEYEETSPEGLKETNRDQRLSTYLSAAWLVNDMISINHVTYFQPNLSDFSDFRISSETNLSVKINDYVALKTYFQFIYDSRPPITVPKSMYVLTNGLSVHF
jgi:hypothetical protein